MATTRDDPDDLPDVVDVERPWSIASLEVLAAVAEEFPPGSVHRGLDYLESGRVRELTFGERGVSAQVHGRRVYRTAWRLETVGWMPTCTCPVAPDCKHAYALACRVLLERHPPKALAESWVADLLPAELVLERLAAADGVDSRTLQQSRALHTLRTADFWIDRVEALGCLLGERLHTLRDACLGPEFRQAVHEPDPDLRCHLVARLLAPRLGGELPEVLQGFLERTELAQHIGEREQQALVGEFAGWLASTGDLPAGPRHQLRLEACLDAAAEGCVSLRWRALLTSPRLVDAPRTLEQLRLLQSDVQRDDRRLPPAQADLLDALLGSVPAAPSLATRQDTRHDLAHADVLRLLALAGDSELVRWAQDMPPALARAGGIEPGAAVRLGGGSARCVPVVSEAQASARIVLELHLPDGTRARPGGRLLAIPRDGPGSQPTLAVAHGQVWSLRGAPPPTVLTAFERSGGLEPPRAAQSDLLPTLAARFPEFQDSLAPWCRHHPTQPVVLLELADDDWLGARLFASADPGWRPGSRPGRPLFEWRPEQRWSLLPTAEGLAVGARDTSDPVQVFEASPEALADHAGAPAPAADVTSGPSADAGPDASADASADTSADTSDNPPTNSRPITRPPLLELPEEADVRAVLAWWSRLELHPATAFAGGRRSSRPPHSRGHWLRLTAAHVDALAAAWETRPAGVTWYGDGAARRLFANPSRPMPTLRIRKSGVDWFSVSSQWAAEGAALGDDDLGWLRDATGSFVRLPSGWVRRDAVAAELESREALAELGLEAEGSDQRVSFWQLLQAGPGARAMLDAAADPETRKVVAALRRRVAAFKGLRRVAVPSTIQATLRPYQRDGLDFLAYAGSLGLGVILADDMGLGKTLQALCWLARLIAAAPRGGPSLVVCPASVLHNWERELARFAPRLSVLALVAGRGRAAQAARIPKHDVVLTTYALLRRDQAALAEVDWRAVILDEAQNIKNPDAAVSRAARSLRAGQRLALTGTPLENRALDLWSLQAFLNPGLLGTRAAFERRYEGPDAAAHERRLLHSRLRPTLLRRLKSEVARDLPARIEEQRDCELTSAQRKLYLAELAAGRALVDGLDDAGVRRQHVNILALLTRLRLACCHPALVGGRADLPSGKFTALFELLEPLLAEGHKVLVFSQFVKCLDLLAAELGRRGLAHHLLTGASRRRGELVRAFQEDPEPSVFLISTKAGGTGLNLTAASYVVLFDPWWNPAVEAQAIDRAHRIGQDQTVIAYRLVAKGTIEERIRELQEHKTGLARDLLGGEGLVRTLTRDDLQALLGEP